jgi:hypothetical protein
MFRFYRYSFPLVLLLISSLSASSTAQTGFGRGMSIQLAAFTDPDNSIRVSIQLSQSLDGKIILSATFEAPKDYHLYSKDLVQLGFTNQGRPTRIDLPPGSKMKAAGSLSASAESEIYGHDPEGPPVYPEGPVTLSIPVKLPASQNGWVDDTVSLTYMACSLTTCGSPTVGKHVNVRIPELAAIGNP